jgi:general stress protein YciG
MADSNPANFANLPKDQLKEIAAKGGHASHGASGSSSNDVRLFLSVTRLPC